MHRLPLAGFINVYRRQPHLLLLALLLKPFKAKCLETELYHIVPAYRMLDHELTGRCSEAFEAATEVLEVNGFRRVGFDHQDAIGGTPEMTAALHYRDNIGTIAITCITQRSGQRDRFEVATALATRMVSGSVVQTTNPIASMPPPPFLDRRLLRQAEVSQLIAEHLPRITKEDAVWRDLTDEDVIMNHQEFVEDLNQYFRGCGVYGPLVPK